MLLLCARIEQFGQCQPEANTDRLLLCTRIKQFSQCQPEANTDRLLLCGKINNSVNQLETPILIQVKEHEHKQQEHYQYLDS